MAYLAIACGGEAPAPVAPPPLPPPVASAPPAPPPPPETKPTLEQLLNVQRATVPAAISSTSLLYLSDAPGTPQIFRIGAITVAADGKVAEIPKSEKVTEFPDRIAAMRVSPNGKVVLFLKDTGGDENGQIFRMAVDAASGATATALTVQPKTKHTLPSFDDASTRIAFTSNARNGKDMDLYVEDASAPATPTTSRTPALELPGSFSVADFRKDTVLLSEERSNADGDLWLFDVKTKKKTKLTKHALEERYEDAAFSNDGKAVIVATDAGREFMGVVAIDIATGRRTPLVTEPHDVKHLTVHRRDAAVKPEKGTPADTLVYAVNIDGVEEVSFATLTAARKVEKRTPTPLRGFVNDISIAPDGAAAFVAMEASKQPTEISRLDLVAPASAASPVTASDHAGIVEADLVAEELVTVKSFDGKPVSCFLYAKPAVPGEKRPLVLSIHGGPESQAQPSFSPVTQYLVAHGYAVAAPNVRGSVGYGKSFAHLDDKDRREHSVRDLSEVGKFFAERPDIDGKRIALYGGSYGGYMVLAGLTLYPDQWAAGVDIVGIANFRTFLEQTAPYRRALREAEYGSLAKDGELLDHVSPIHNVDKIKAPLMVVHGTRDPRVPVGEAKQIAEAVKARGLPVELLTFDDEGHGIARRKNRLVAYPKVVEFLDANVKNAVAPREPAPPVATPAKTP